MGLGEAAGDTKWCGMRGLMAWWEESTHEIGQMEVVSGPGLISQWVL